MQPPSPQPARVVIPLALALVMMALFVGSGFMILRPSPAWAHAPAQGLTNVIKNGDFEQNPTSSIATYWQLYDNGQAHFGWYDEHWVEAVHSGQHSQLMEIFQVEGYVPDRVMAIYQTVDVIPNSNYMLTLHALMRSDAPAELRNKGEYGMDWGIDYSGAGKYHFVEQWVTMPISEQLRIGSNGQSSDDQTHLYFQRITATVYTGNSNRLTLFIRGVKAEPTGTEVNYNVDDVTLIGPYVVPPTPTPTRTPVPIPTFPPTPTVTPTPTLTPTVPGPSLPITGNPVAPPAEQQNLPGAGATLPRTFSAGGLALAGLVLIILGVRAAVNLLAKHKKG